MGGKCIPFWAYLPICMSMQFFLQFDSSMICFCSTQAQLALYKSWKEVLDCRKWNCSSVPVITLFVPTSTGMILGLPWLRAMCIAIKLLGPLVIQISQVFQISRSPRCHPGPDIPELLKISLEWWRCLLLKWLGLAGALPKTQSKSEVGTQVAGYCTL